MSEHVNIETVHFSAFALRSIDIDHPGYQLLLASIKEKGQLVPISVREKGGIYEIIDGNHRFEAMQQLGRITILVKIHTLTDAEVLVHQIIQSRQYVPIRMHEYTLQLKRILSYAPTLTLTALSVKLKRTCGWIREHLNLLRITDPSIQAKINIGHICLANAYAIAKLPAMEQLDWIYRAEHYSPDEFVPLVTMRFKGLVTMRFKGLVLAARRPVSTVHDEITVSRDQHPHNKMLVNVDYDNIRMKGTPIAEPLIRRGWDHVAGRQAPYSYCRGDVLVLYTGRHWAIDHRRVQKLGNLSFTTAIEAMEFIEEYFDA